MPPKRKRLAPDELISLAEASSIYHLGQDFLRQLALKGRLRAKKIGRNWVTTPQAIEDYLASRKKTGAYRADIDD